jgi:hypothetical protein
VGKVGQILTSRKWLVWIPLGGFVVAFVMSQLFFVPAMTRNRVREALSNAKPSELGEAVGPLGAVLHFKDGSWIAIGYRDDHSLLPWSVAVARDSGGGWFESAEHFCGHLAVLRSVDESGRVSRKDTSPPRDPPTDRREWMRLLAISPDLRTARQRMARYFHQIE